MIITLLLLVVKIIVVISIVPYLNAMGDIALYEINRNVYIEPQT